MPGEELKREEISSENEVHLRREEIPSDTYPLPTPEGGWKDETGNPVDRLGNPMPWEEAPEPERGEELEGVREGLEEEAAKEKRELGEKQRTTSNGTKGEISIPSSVADPIEAKRKRYERKNILNHMVGWTGGINAVMLIETLPKVVSGEPQALLFQVAATALGIAGGGLIGWSINQARREQGLKPIGEPGWKENSQVYDKKK